MTLWEQRQGSTSVQLDLSDKLGPHELLRVQRLARELRLTDQILSVDVDKVNVEPAGPAPAWTTLEGDKITFAYNQMPKPDTPLHIAVWLGTNAHELGHVLYSPRKSSTLMFRVLESDRTYLRGVAQLHNVVEDQRQERLILSRFAPWAGYLTAALGHHIKPDNGNAWLLLAGRTWLPQAVRDEARTKCIASHGQHVTDEVTRLVGDYQRLSDPGEGEVDDAWQILEELHALFADQMPTLPTPCVVMTHGEPDNDGAEEAQVNAPAAADESGTDDSDDGDGDDDGDDDGTDDDDDEQSQSHGQGGGQGGGAGNEKADTPIDPRSFSGAISDAARETIEQDEDAKRDLDSVTESLDKGRSNERAEGADATGEYVEATDAARRLHHEVADALLDLKDESEPGWLRRVDSGRLNVRRLAMPNVDADALFDRYESGQLDSTEFDVVLLLDVSGSMAREVKPLAEATWAIRSAVDDLEGSITVFAFDSGPHEVLAYPGERPDGRMFVPRAKGGTNPESALREAFRVIAGSAARSRLVIIMSDGDWNSSQPDAIVRALNECGVTTVLAVLGGSGAITPDAQHGCQYAEHIADPAGLARLFRKVALDRVRASR